MTQISYVLVVPTEKDKSTFFQGWQRGVASNDFIHLLASAALAPIDTAEIFLPQDELVSYRTSGTHKNIITIGSHLIDEIPNLVTGDFIITITPSDFLDKIMALDIPKQKSMLIAAPTEAPGVINLAKFSPPDLIYSFDKPIHDELKKISRRSEDQQAVPAQTRNKYIVSASCPHYGSGVTLANEILHTSLGFRFTSHETIKPALLDSFYSAIKAGVESIIAATPGKDTREVIVYSPSIMGLYYNTNSNFWNQLFRKIKASWVKDFVKNGLIKNPGYSGISISPGTNNLENPYDIPYVGEVLRERQFELAATNYSIGLLATNECIPAIRLPNAVNLHQAKLKDLEFTHKRTDPKSLRQLQLKFKALSSEIKSNISNQLSDLISTSFDSCKICSDAPIEWVYLGDLPLMISHEVSKIPMTPGNMLLQFASLGAPIAIPARALQDILVIRSFSNHDKIKKFLEVAVGCFPLENGTNVEFVDVTSISEVIAALNKFDGAIVIFDCHGDHGGIAQPGWLQIGKERLDSWDLYNKARVPPVVMLSACSTFSVGGSHASAANGFLRSGALSVIGTMLPVDAAKSSAFIARIIFRLDAFLPAVHKLGYDLISWRTLISLFFRMSYATDVLRHFMDMEHVITRDQYTKIHINTNHRINLFDSSWYEAMLQEVSDASGLACADLLFKIKDENPFLETMLYCQLGRPELLNIILANKEDS
ncbi:hypothetical protein PPC_3559 [Pseudomonas protegens Cab57]|uniref:CHAT domain-containing protein n=1 Tax=Pseudomonas protegens TaxID=380021 RepID=UPI0004424A14|nr:CHAT domain-containing protein [Pseudomonas protegens]BAO62906.1 hypothetical protein PPC_3559 [Pseudomonas protegens Cab57]